MATKSSQDELEERLNFMRFSVMLMEDMRGKMAELLKTLIKPDMKGVWNDTQENGEWFAKKYGEPYHKDQKYLVAQGDTTKWDITLILFYLKRLHPSNNDKNTLNKLKIMRDCCFGHVHEAKIPTSEYLKYVEEILKYYSQLKWDPAGIHRIKKENFDGGILTKVLHCCEKLYNELSSSFKDLQSKNQDQYRSILDNQSKTMKELQQYFLDYMKDVRQTLEFKTDETSKERIQELTKKIDEMNSYVLQIPDKAYLDHKIDDKDCKDAARLEEKDRKDAARLEEKDHKDAERHEGVLSELQNIKEHLITPHMDKSEKDQGHPKLYSSFHQGECEQLNFKKIEDAYTLIQELSELVSDLEKHVANKGKINDAKRILLEYLPMSLYENLDETTQQMIKEEEDVSKIFLYYKDYYNYFQFEIIKACVHAVGDDHLKVRMETYKQNCSEYIKTTAIEQCLSGTDESKNCVIKLQCHKDIKVERLKNLLSQIKGYLLEFPLCVKGIRPGCISLTFHISSIIAKVAFSLLKKKLKLLQKKNFGQFQLIEVSWEDQRFQIQEPNQDEWQYLEHPQVQNKIDTLMTKDIVMCSLQHFNEMCSEALKNMEVITNLHSKAKEGNMHDIKMEINRNKYDPTEHDKMGNTALHCAATNCNMSVLTFLLEETNIDPTAKNNFGRTALHIAVIIGKIATTKYLLDTKKFDPFQPDKYGWNSLHYACALGFADIALLFTGIIEEVWNHCVTYEDFKFYYFHIAIGKGHFDVVQNILHKSKPDALSLCLAVYYPKIFKFLLNQVFYSPKSLHSALFVASACGIWESIEVLLKQHCCNLLVKDNNGDTPLHYAAEAGQLGVMSKLIAVLQEPLINGNKHKSLLHRIIASSNVHVLKLFAESQFKLTCSNGSKTTLNDCKPLPDLDEATPLHFASCKGCLKVVQYFIDDLKVEPELKDKMQKTSLYYACEKGHCDIVIYLVTENNCNPLLHQGKDQDTPLHCASACGHFEIVKCLVYKLKGDFPNDITAIIENLENSNGETALHKAALNGHTKIVKYYIKELKLNPNSEGKTKQTILHVASEKGHLDIVKYLTEEFDCNPLCVDEDSTTPLHLASIQGHLSVIEYLVSVLEHRQTQLNIANIIDFDGNAHQIIAELKNQVNIAPFWNKFRIALNCASACGHFEIVKYLVFKLQSVIGFTNISEMIEVLVKPDEVLVKPDDTALHNAALNGHTKIVKYYLEDLKMNPNSKGQWGQTILHIASEKGRLEIVKCMTDEFHCDPLCIDKDQVTPLHLASQEGHLDVIEHLVSVLKRQQINFNIDELRDDEGDTPLHYAALENQVKVVEYWNKFGSIYVKGQWGRTALHMASEHGNLETVKYLAPSYNNHSFYTDDDNATPMHCAAGEGHLEVLKVLTSSLLTDPQSEFQKKDIHGDTPLHYASLYGHLNIVEYLVTYHNVPPDIIGQQGGTPLEMALAEGHRDVAEFLINILCEEKSNVMQKLDADEEKKKKKESKLQKKKKHEINFLLQNKARNYPLDFLHYNARQVPAF